MISPGSSKPSGDSVAGLSSLKNLRTGEQPAGGSLLLVLAPVVERERRVEFSIDEHCLHTDPLMGRRGTGRIQRGGISHRSASGKARMLETTSGADTGSQRQPSTYREGRSTHETDDGDRATGCHHVEMALLPRSLTVESLNLRCWSPNDANRMLIAIEESFSELEQWMTWAQQAPSAKGLREVLRQGEIDFHADRGWDYTILDPQSDDVVGAAGLHRTEDPERFEIGYWVRTTRTRRGIATSATQALINAAATYLDPARQIVIRMDQANLPSISVPRKLGFKLESEEDREIVAKGHTGRGYIWILHLPD
jgi:RimJ/RimL family protein N-acetyltransferase